MKDASHDTSFWGPFSPLSSISGAALIIMATARFSDAILVSLCIFFVYTGSVLLLNSSRSLLPQRGRGVMPVLVSSLFSYIFIVLLGLFLPVSVLDLGFCFGLVPVCFVSQELFSRTEKMDAEETVTLAFKDAGFISLLLLGFALVREPLGFGCLSIPSVDGALHLFEGMNRSSAACRWITSSSGGLIVLGYAVALYRIARSRVRKDGEQSL